MRFRIGVWEFVPASMLLEKIKRQYIQVHTYFTSTCTRFPSDGVQLPSMILIRDPYGPAPDIGRP